MKKMKSVLTLALIATTSLTALSVHADEETGMQIRANEWSLESEQAVSAALASDKPIVLNTSIRNKDTNVEIFMQCVTADCNEFVFVKRVPETGRNVQISKGTFTRESLYETAASIENRKSPAKEQFTAFQKYWKAINFNEPSTISGNGFGVVVFKLTIASPATVAVILYDGIRAPFKMVGNLFREKAHKKEGKELKEVLKKSIALSDEDFVNLYNIITQY